MFITPISFQVEGCTIPLDQAPQPVPLPPWSGVPVALEMETDRQTLAELVQHAGEGLLLARDEQGLLVACSAYVDPQGSHTCETDTVLMLVQCGPLEPRERL